MQDLGGMLQGSRPWRYFLGGGRARWFSVTGSGLASPYLPFSTAFGGAPKLCKPFKEIYGIHEDI